MYGPGVQYGCRELKFLSERKEVLKTLLEKSANRLRACRPNSEEAKRIRRNIRKNQKSLRNCKANIYSKRNFRHQPYANLQTPPTDDTQIPLPTLTNVKISIPLDQLTPESISHLYCLPAPPPPPEFIPLPPPEPFIPPLPKESSLDRRIREELELL